MPELGPRLTGSPEGRATHVWHLSSRKRLAAGRVQLCGDVEELLATHRRLSGPRRSSARLSASLRVIEESHTDRQSTLLVRTEDPIPDPAWSVEAVGVEDIVLAYLASPGRPAAELEPARIER